MATTQPGSGHGGARDGAGRKRKADKYEPQINRAEKKIADKLPKLIDNLLHLANGGYERVEEKFMRVHVRDEKGEKVYDDNDEPVFEFVVVERKVSIADKDRAANTYLIDRILGRPSQTHELGDEDGELVPFAIVRVPMKLSSEQWQQQAQQHANQKNVTPAEPSSSQPCATTNGDSSSDESAS